MNRRDGMAEGKDAGCFVVRHEELPHGFRYGSARVERLLSDRDKGWVVIGILTPKSSLQVYVTKTGKVRVYDDVGEWSRP